MLLVFLYVGTPVAVILTSEQWHPAFLVVFTKSNMQYICHCCTCAGDSFFLDTYFYDMIHTHEHTVQSLIMDKCLNWSYLKDEYMLNT